MLIFLSSMGIRKKKSDRIHIIKYCRSLRSLLDLMISTRAVLKHFGIRDCHFGLVSRRAPRSGLDAGQPPPTPPGGDGGMGHAGAFELKIGVSAKS